MTFTEWVFVHCDTHLSTALGCFSLSRNGADPSCVPREGLGEGLRTQQLAVGRELYSTLLFLGLTVDTGLEVTGKGRLINKFPEKNSEVTAVDVYMACL